MTAEMFYPETVMILIVVRMEVIIIVVAAGMSIISIAKIVERLIV
jgi:hypothetical protein